MSFYANNRGKQVAINSAFDPTGCMEMPSNNPACKGCKHRKKVGEVVVSEFDMVYSVRGCCHPNMVRYRTDEEYRTKADIEQKAWTSCQWYEPNLWRRLLGGYKR